MQILRPSMNLTDIVLEQKELEELLLSIDTSKAQGSDQIPAQLLKECAREISDPASDIQNYRPIHYCQLLESFLRNVCIPELSIISVNNYTSFNMASWKVNLVPPICCKCYMTSATVWTMQNRPILSTLIMRKPSTKLIICYYKKKSMDSELQETCY